MNKLQIDDLILFLKADTTLNPIFWDRVFFISSVNDQAQTSLYINTLSENRKQDTNETLIDFRIISPNIEIGPLQITEYLDKIRDVFEQNDFNTWSFKYFQIDTLNDTFVQQNAKKHYEGVTTFIFKNSK